MDSQSKAGLEDLTSGEATERREDGIRERMERATDAGRDVFGGGSMPEGAVQHVTDGLTHLAEHLRNADLGEMGTKATRFARENPALTLAGAALAGFAVARFLKSSSDGDASRLAARSSGDDPWLGHLAGARDMSGGGDEDRDSHGR